MDILKIQNLPQVSAGVNGKVRQKDTADFGKVIKGAIEKVDRLEKNADQSVIDLLQGKASIHETMIALQKADMSMQLLLNIRNKAIESYRDIMHMQF
jgi:flagellar hook-basal body complex protein FliE